MAVNFFTGYDNPDFNGGADQSNIDSEISNLMSGNLGKQMAANSTGRIRSMALDNLRTFSNNPSLGRNASVSAAFGDKIQGEAGRGIIDANLRGAEFDQRSQIQGAQLSEQNRAFKYNDFQRKLERSDRPSPFASALTSLATNAIGTFAGYGVSKLAKNVFGDSKDDDTDPTQVRDPIQSNQNFNLLKGFSPFPNYSPTSNNRNTDQPYWN